MLRTHACGALTPELVGQTVTLCGWLHRRRDHGGLSFFDLRDRSGLAQVVFNAKVNAELHQQAKAFGPEYVLRITGAVRGRPKGTENPKLPSGMVEVGATAVEVLNTATPPVFEIDDHIEVTEDVRMQWRYLDLRRPVNQQRLILRHRVTQAIRQEMDGQGFLEIETPILTKSTPEGARDYLVPSRLNPGRFFALPQSPQLFKQLLMVAGMERYYQVARCFRDEDLRADRQPEFTQLDLEMSFVGEEDIYGVVERVIARAFQEALGVTLPTPFPRMSHHQAKAKHQTDKPDLRTPENPWGFCWVTEFPMFQWNEETTRWDAEHHPFTAPHADDVAAMAQDPGTVRSRAYDLVLNGIELGSGSIRIHDAATQRAVFGVLGLSDEVVEERFGFLLQAFSYGAPPHGGFAFGLDRLVALMAGTDSIREVIAFPKTAKAVCPLTGAPSEARPEQLKDLGITVVAARKGERAPGGTTTG
jgi:aspartyl-tRNA synthetase